MRTIFLISCVKKKSTIARPARELYISPLFKLSLAYAEKQRPDKIYILSALHGAIELDQPLQPYEQTLVGKRAAELLAWGHKVQLQLAEKTDLKHDRFIFLAGEKYQTALKSSLSHWEDPLHGLGLGKRLKWLKEKTK